jgi:hypothetical protein
MVHQLKARPKSDRIGSALKAGVVVAAVALVALSAHHGGVVPPESTAHEMVNGIATTMAAPDAHYLPSQYDEHRVAPDTAPAPTF